MLTEMVEREKAKYVRVPPGNSYHGWVVEHTRTGQRLAGPFRTRAEAVAARTEWLRQNREASRAKRP